MIDPSTGAGLLGALAVLGAAPGGEGGQLRGRPSLALDPAGCPSVGREEVRLIVAVELRTSVSLEDAANLPATPRLAVACSAGAATLRFDDPVTGKTVIRTVDISATAPIALARLIALSIAELVSASWAELMLVRPQGPDRAPSPAPSAPAEVRQQALEIVRERAGRRRPLRTLAMAYARSWLEGAPAAGGGLRVGRDLGPRLGWQVDVVYDHHSIDTILGSVAVDIASLGLGLATHARRSGWTLGAGAGARIAATRLTGTPSRPEAVTGHSFTAPSWGPTLGLCARITPTGSFLIELAMEAGYLLFPVGGYASATRTVSIDGVWIGASLGVGFEI